MILLSNNNNNNNNTDTCVLTLPLRVEKWQEDCLLKRFEAARRIYNSLLNFELKKLRQLERTVEYRQIQSVISSAYRSNTKDSPECKDAFKRREKLISANGISENGFKSDVKFFYKHFDGLIGSSVAVHCIAVQLWAAFDKYLSGSGKEIHFKRLGDISSLKGYSVKGKSGGREIIFRGQYVEWTRKKKKLLLPLKIDPDNEYEREMLSRRVKYVRIIKKPGKNRLRWYAQLTLEGKPALKYSAGTGKPIHSVGKGNVGIDIGPQTVAYASDKEVALLELADRVTNIEHQKKKLQRKLDRSRRATNPDNYKPDGTIKRGVKLTRNKSKRYLKLQSKLAYIQHRQAEIRKLQHTCLANHMLTLGDRFFVEKMNWPGLAHRAKETSISEKTGRYKRKKRFGKSLANKAPAMFISILKRKCETLGLPGVVEVDTYNLKASQYNHLSDTYEKKSLSERWNYMPISDGSDSSKTKRIQRDLYSAFLLQHTIPQPCSFDKEALRIDYPNFVTMHDAEIHRLESLPKTITSMGVRRSHS